MDIIKALAEELSLSETKLEKTVELLDDGATVPFIARYRKEVTGGMDDGTLRRLAERLEYLRGMEKRREEIISLISEQGKLTPEIEADIANAQTLAALEDIYRPYRPKRKTRASVARARGLEELASAIAEQRDEYSPAIEELAAQYIGDEVPNAEAAIAGALDIIAEDISDRADVRGAVRELTLKWGSLAVRGDSEADKDGTYALYYEYSEPLSTIPSHRVLAVNRGEREEVLSVSIDVGSDIILNTVYSMVITNHKSPAARLVLRAMCDSYSRLIAPSIEREVRATLTENAGEAAIALFSDNLRHLLMQAPLKGKVVLGFDPGYRTGCKLAVVDSTGKVLECAVIYPTKPQEKIRESEAVIRRLIERYGIDVIAIGNGTASGESERFVANMLCRLDRDVKYIIVSEAGASVYSASKAGAEEFPDFDVTERSAVSIARRLQDPLAELVKIEPRSIGVGQYQHDMKAARLDEALAGVVESCVNAVGADLNTASYSLLSYISGISAAAAKNIVKYREENGAFKRRRDILRVPRIGDKVYNMCVGFLRVPESDDIFDNTGVHPESAAAASALLESFGYTKESAASGCVGLGKAVAKVGTESVAEKLGIGVPTLTDIISELEKPGRDSRDELPLPELRDRAISIEELEVGMKLTGVVRNVIDFGAFVDIGVHQDGLVHVSEMSDRFVKHPSEVLSVGDTVSVRVKDVDLKRRRIALTMKTK